MLSSHNITYYRRFAISVMQLADFAMFAAAKNGFLCEIVAKMVKFNLLQRKIYFIQKDS